MTSIQVLLNLLIQLIIDNIVGTVHCVRWNPSGDLLATASNDRTAQVLDFGTEKVLCTETTLDGSQ